MTGNAPAWRYSSGRSEPGCDVPALDRSRWIHHLTGIPDYGRLPRLMHQWGQRLALAHGYGVTRTGTGGGGEPFMEPS